MQIMIERITSALNSIRLPAMPEESMIHDSIISVLCEQGISFIHEAKLGSGCRIDFLCDTIGIEVKKGKPRPGVLKKQIARYLTFDAVEALIVVTQRPCTLPTRISGKPVYLFSIDRLWGVALP